MAPNEGVEAVTTAETDATDVGPAPVDSDAIEPGTVGPETVDSAELSTNGHGGAAPSGEDDFGVPGRPSRTGRKRTARQRALLVRTDVGQGRVEGPVDPLLGPADTGSLAEIEATPPDSDSAESRLVDTELVPEVSAAPADPEPPAPVIEADWLEPAPALRTAPIAVDFTGTAPVPLPVLMPDGNGQAVTPPIAVPAPPLVVPPPPKPRRRARPRVRKVTRIVRSVDAWSVFKVALIFFVAMGVVMMTAAVLLWNLAQSTGTLDNVEGFFREAFNYDTFKLQSDPLFHAALVLTVLFVVAGTGLSVVMAVLFNLIADLTGGIRVTVLEREVVARDDPRGRKRRRQVRAQTRRSATAPPTTSPPAAPPLVG